MVTRCGEWARVEGYLNATLETQTDKIEAERHLLSCPECSLQARGQEDRTGILTAVLAEGCPSQLSDYEVVRQLGQGGNAKVILVRNVVNDEQLAVKLPNDNDPQKVSREGHILASIKHPGIVHCNGPIVLETMEGLKWGLAFEYLEGGSLADFVDNQKLGSDPNFFGRVIAILEQVARTLDTLHAGHPALVHLDLKPHNVLLALDYTPRLGDFGTAQFRKELTIRGYHGEGTLGFAAPEQVHSPEKVGPASDVWALGHLISYSLGTYQNRNPKNPDAPLYPISSKYPSSVKLSEIVASCLTENPDDRPRALKVADSLRDVLREANALATNRLPSKRNALLLAVGLTIIGVFLALVTHRHFWPLKTNLGAAIPYEQQRAETDRSVRPTKTADDLVPSSIDLSTQLKEDEEKDVSSANILKLPKGYPDRSAFKKDQLSTQEFPFEWKRSPGTGGHNHDGNWEVEKGRVIVAAEIVTLAEHHTKGHRDLHFNYSQRNNRRLPTGVHNGHRLTPGQIFGAGAAYKGIIKVWTVNEDDWYRAAEKSVGPPPIHK